MGFDEILYMIACANRAEELDERREEIAEWLPLVRTMFEYDQKNHAHQYDLWQHTLHVTAALPKGLDDEMLYLAALLHDIGKPLCQVHGKRENDTDMHYYGHPEKSAELVEQEVLVQLEHKGVVIPEPDKRRLLYYVRYHDDHVSYKPKHLKRHLELVQHEVLEHEVLESKILEAQVPESGGVDLQLSASEEKLRVFQKLMLLQVADAKIHVQKPVIAERIENCSRMSDWDELMELYRTTVSVYEKL